MAAKRKESKEMNLTDLGDTLIEKQILRVGEWKHKDAPDGKLTITEDYLKKIAKNFFEAKSPVPVYRGHRTNEDAEANPELILNKNVENVSLRDGALYAQMKIDEKELEKYNDVSASINPLYEDHETGKFLGPVLNHIAFVMNPYLKGLESFTKLSEKKGNFNILLSELNMADQTPTQDPTEEETKIETTPTEVEQKEEVKEEVESKPEEKVETPEVPVNASESSGEVMIRLAELEKRNKELSDKINLAEAEKSYDDLLHKCKVLPTMKNEFIALSQYGSNTINLSDGSKKTIKQLVINLFDKLPVLFNLKEKGVNVELGDNMDTQLLSNMKEAYMKRTPNATEEGWNKYVSDPITQKVIKEETQRRSNKK